MGLIYATIKEQRFKGPAEGHADGGKGKRKGKDPAELPLSIQDSIARAKAAAQAVSTGQNTNPWANQGGVPRQQRIVPSQTPAFPSWMSQVDDWTQVGGDDTG